MIIYRLLSKSDDDDNDYDDDNVAAAAESVARSRFAFSALAAWQLRTTETSNELVYLKASKLETAYFRQYREWNATKGDYI